MTSLADFSWNRFLKIMRSNANLPTLKVLKTEYFNFSSKKIWRFSQKQIKAQVHQKRKGRELQKVKNSTTESPLHHGTVAINLIRVGLPYGGTSK